HFIEPWENTCEATFTLVPEGTGTKVTWAMEGKNNFMGKVAGMFMNMDAMVGADFEKGLVALKEVGEGNAKKAVETAAAAAAAAATEAQAKADATAPKKTK